MSRSRPVFTTIAAGVAPTAALVALLAHRPAAVEPTSWRSASTDDLVVALAWATAAGIAAWLALGTVACVVASRRPGAQRAAVLARFAPAILRRLVEAAFATSVVVGPAGPAFAGDSAANAPIPVHVRADATLLATQGGAGIVDEPVVRAPVPPATPATPAAPAAPDPAPVAPAARMHVVARGDNLWAIARAELVATGTEPGPDAVARYWRALVDENRATLRSGNPSLIYPGEIVTIPPVAG